MRRVLIIEDDADQREILALFIREAGWEVLEAANGEAGIKAARSWSPEVIFCDLLMEGVNGFQVCRQLKTSPATQDIKILMMTSKSQDSDRFWGLKQGADDYMTKPYEDEELLSNIANLLRTAA